MNTNSRPIYPGAMTPEQLIRRAIRRATTAAAMIALEVATFAILATILF